jgi:hypothetical protein
VRRRGGQFFHRVAKAVGQIGLQTRALGLRHPRADRETAMTVKPSDPATAIYLVQSPDVVPDDDSSNHENPKDFLKNMLDS